MEMRLMFENRTPRAVAHVVTLSDTIAASIMVKA